MAENPKSCVICGGTESESELLLAAPCGRHFVCHDDISSYFERATKDESLFPPQCCGQMFALDDYEDYVPFDISWAYQVKEHGEYAVLAKFRVYCASPTCAKFLPPSAHVKDEDMKITYAICEDGACGALTCVGCRTLLKHGVQGHVCKKDEEEEKFKQITIEKGYQGCNICGATIELIEACNHITCGCGHDFCYICGKDWQGVHGCPHYGPATYDEEDYNQEGYHRDTGLNREGLTRRQENMRRRDEDGDDDDEDRDEEDENEGEEDDDPDWEVLQHLTPDQRVVVNTLHGVAREDALDQLRITLFETQGIMFGHQTPPPAIDPDEEDENENQDEHQDEHDNENENEDRDEEGSETQDAGIEDREDGNPDDQTGELDGPVNEDIFSGLFVTGDQETEDALPGSPADPDPSHDAPDPTHDPTIARSRNLHRMGRLLFEPDLSLAARQPSQPPPTLPWFNLFARSREMREQQDREPGNMLRNGTMDDEGDLFDAGADARTGAGAADENTTVSTISAGHTEQEAQPKRDWRTDDDALFELFSAGLLRRTSPVSARTDAAYAKEGDQEDEGEDQDEDPSRQADKDELHQSRAERRLESFMDIFQERTQTPLEETATATETGNRQTPSAPSAWPEWDDAEI
ncbi:hypothetical protein BKA63DRAFT_565907 [Paraphoma chrysanthemicola]|nr:hypothetical protein BKA63DRAFT_565907 [Paraphoma chrysanthemicola]